MALTAKKAYKQGVLTIFAMADAAVYFAERPAVPETDSDEDMVWRKESAITFDGGYISATYGNLVQTWNLGQSLSTCSGVDVQRSAYTAKRANKIGDPKVDVSVPSSTYKRFPRKNGSLAAGGLPYTFVTDIGTYTARIGGDVETCVQWICDNRNTMYGTLTIYTNRGAQYGPFGNQTT